MPDLVLWKRLFEYDFNDINAKGAQSGSGGGARHIALSVEKKSFPIRSFLRTTGNSISVHTEDFSGHFPGATLTFVTDPKRRGGEWRIADQFTHRHPAWSSLAGFPTTSADRPYVFVARVAGRFHARFRMESTLATLSEGWRQTLSKSRGIASVTTELLTFLSIPPPTLLDVFSELASEGDFEFDPANAEDGRVRIVTSVLRRQGQPAFRNALVQAYGQRCAISSCSSLWVLEAAHITPYRGLATNRVSNGLLLRADVHTLFDLGLISINPESRTVVVSSLLDGSEYADLAASKLAEPKHKTNRPSMSALAAHFSQFRA